MNDAQADAILDAATDYAQARVNLERAIYRGAPQDTIDSLYSSESTTLRALLTSIEAAR